MAERAVGERNVTVMPQYGVSNMGEGGRGPSGSRTLMTATISPAAPTNLPPAENAPPWLRLLMMLGTRLPATSVGDGIGARAVVAAPTSRHVAAALAVTGVNLPDALDAASPESESRVATVLSKSFCDATVRTVGERIAFDGTQFAPTRRPPSVALPEQWEFERVARPVPADAVSAARAIDGSAPGEWTFQRACFDPVVVIAQRPSEIVADLEDLAEAVEWWNPVQALALVEPHEGLDWWYRRPVIVSTPIGLAHSPWVSVLPSRLVVVVGFTAWMSPMRHLWSRTPQVLVLNQRTSDVADFRAWFDGTQFPEVALPTMRNLRKAGVTVTAFGEPVTNEGLTALTVDGGDEWEF